MIVTAPTFTSPRRPVMSFSSPRKSSRAELFRQHRALALSDRLAPAPDGMEHPDVVALAGRNDRCEPGCGDRRTEFEPSRGAALSRLAGVASPSRSGFCPVHPGLDLQRLSIDGRRSVAQWSTQRRALARRRAAMERVQADEVSRVFAASNLLDEPREIEWFALAGNIYRSERADLEEQRLALFVPEMNAVPAPRAFLRADEIDAAAKQLGGDCGHASDVKPTLSDTPVFRIICGDIWYEIDGSTGALLSWARSRAPHLSLAFQAACTGLTSRSRRPPSRAAHVCRRRALLMRPGLQSLGCRAGLAEAAENKRRRGRAVEVNLTKRSDLIPSGRGTLRHRVDLAITSASSVRSAAAKISASWSSCVAPTMVEATKSCCLLQAVARVDDRHAGLGARWPRSARSRPGSSR